MSRFVRLMPTEDGYGVYIGRYRLYEVYVPDWSEMGESAIVFPFGPVSLVIEWRRAELPPVDPWNVRVALDIRRGRWCYELGLHSRRTRLYPTATIDD